MLPDFIVVGAGIFGLTAALELKERGYKITVVDPGPIPHPLAASTDISKVVRMEYGRDAQYMEMAEQSLPGWRVWNERFAEALYHEVGVTMVTKTAMQPGGFEHDSYQMLLSRGHTPERLDTDEISRRFPAWRSDRYIDGFFHAKGGYAESGRVVEKLYKRSLQKGIVFRNVRAISVEKDNGRVSGILTDKDGMITAGKVLIASGAWTQELVPALKPLMKATGHPVFHLEPSDPTHFQPPIFSVFTADIAHSGWYGFPVAGKGVLKVGNHGVGQDLHPQNDARLVTSDDEAKLRTFLADTFPSIEHAPIVYTRRCLYSDTLDEHFVIDEHPDIDGLYVAAGGSGHGFKFAPILGGLIADCVEDQENDWLAKFVWRDLAAATKGEESARFHGE